MRILQLIDTLDAGGAERMAVNYANALSSKMEFSGIAVTRKEGNLQLQLKKEVNYFFLNKKTTFDFKAIFRLNNIIKSNKIDVIHAHGTSFFIAFIVKIFNLKTKLIYHEHYGNRSNQSIFNNLLLLFCLLFFNKILVVNHQLQKWFLKNGFTNTFFISNFASFDVSIKPTTKLIGINGKRIVCLANLKNPKNHFFLLQAFNISNLKEDFWTLHLIGENYKDDYSNTISKYIVENNLNEFVSIYDVKSDIQNILSQATIGVLASTNEGFPVTLLEYGLAKLPVISTNVGFCSEIVIENETGLLFNPTNLNEFVTKLKSLILNNELQKQFGEKLNVLIKENYSEEAVLNVYFNFLGKNTINSKWKI